MPLQKLQFLPGVNRESTTLANEGGWFESDKVRFRSGYPEKIGGWAALSRNTFLGACRSLWNWVTLRGFNLVGVGTNLKFYIESGGGYYDVTPIRLNTTNTTTFAAVSGSRTITVTDTGASGLQAGDFVTFSSAVALSTQTYTANTSTDVITFTTALANGTTVTLFTTNTVPSGLSVGTTYYVVNASGATCKLSLTLGGSAIDITTTGTGTQTFALTTGITATVLNAEFQIQSVLSGTSYTITSPVAANAFDTGNGGANTDAAYQINAGPAINTVGTGWGVSPWGGYIPGTSSSTLNGLINSSATTITVVSTSTFTDAGAIWINGEYINYTSKTATDFIVPVSNGRGADGTIAATHSSGSLVSQATSFPGWGEGFSSASGAEAQLRLWSQSNFGEELLFNPRGGAIYRWRPLNAATPALTTRGTIISGPNIPSQVNEIMVSDATRIVIAFGCNDYDPPASPEGAFDPMLVRWCAQEDYEDWTPSATNQAGSYRLSIGSYIVGALQTRQEILIWTDAALYSMQYLGPPFVWGFTLLADNISITSQNAMVTASGVVFWMGTDKFYTYSGRVETLPCTLRKFVFQDINLEQQEQFLSGVNESYSEIWWFYCSAESDVIDRYVIFNYLDRVWYYGTMGRTAWLDSSLRPYPMAATLNNLLVYHEAAVDDGTTSPPSPISAYIQSSDFDIGDGHNYGFVWRIIPDITFDGSNTTGLSSVNPEVRFIVRPRQNPGSGYGLSPSPTVQSADSYAGQQVYNVQEFTEIVYSRIRGRQMAFKIESNALGTQWQLGTPRMDVRPDGRK